MQFPCLNILEQSLDLKTETDLCVLYSEWVPSNIPECIEPLWSTFAWAGRIEAPFSGLPEQRTVIFQLLIFFHLGFTLRRFLLLVVGWQIKDVQV